jgi:RNA polymerase sigma-70 factor (ECF subfamily)
MYEKGFGMSSLCGTNARAPSTVPAGREPSDQELLAGVAASDPAATSAFVGRFGRRVFGLALMIVVDRAVAEEVAGDAFVEASRLAGGFDGRRGTVMSWLLAITRDTAIDALPDRRPAEAASDDVLDGVFEPADRSGLDASVARLRSALQELPDEERRAVLLARLGLRPRDIARRDGIPLATAETLVRAGVERLRTVLSARES